MEKFDQQLNTLQRASLTRITEEQVQAFQHKYEFRPMFEYGRDDNEHYIIRTTRETFKELEYYCALKYEQDMIAIYIEAEIDTTTYVVVAYKKEAHHLGELFQFLAGK
jgi:hypothetical protein